VAGHNERRGRVVNTLHSYSASPEIKSRPGDRLSWPRFFVIFLISFSQLPGYYLKLGHNTFLTQLSNSSFTFNPFIWYYIVPATEKASLNKLQINYIVTSVATHGRDFSLTPSYNLFIHMDRYLYTISQITQAREAAYLSKRNLITCPVTWLLVQDAEGAEIPSSLSQK
jgi:hypothetical protein